MVFHGFVNERAGLPLVCHVDLPHAGVFAGFLTDPVGKSFQPVLATSCERHGGALVGAR